MATTTVTRQAGRSGKLWRHRPFMLFWGGETVSLFGSQVTLLALPLTAVLLLGATAAQLSVVRFVETAPYLLFTLIFGAWVDRRRRRPVLIIANAVRCLLIGAIPLLALLGMLTLPALAAIAFGAGVFTVLFDVAWAAYVPILVPGQDLVEANGKILTSYAAAEVAGPGLAGALVQWLSAPIALIADAVSYCAAMVTLLLIRAREPHPEVHPDAHLLREIGEGLRLVMDSVILRAIAVMSGLWNFFYLIASTIFLLYAVRERGLSPGTLGVILAVGASGGLIGAAVSTRLARRGRFGPILGVAFTFGCASWVLLPAAQGSQAIVSVIFAIAFFWVHMGLGLWGVLTLSLRQAITPARLQGRVSATMRLISYGLGTLGALAAGALGSTFGLPTTLWIAAVGFLTILVVTLVATPLPKVRALPSPAGFEEAVADAAGAALLAPAVPPPPASRLRAPWPQESPS
jgi:predicted MFS family arabinose efflux permease